MTDMEQRLKDELRKVALVAEFPNGYTTEVKERWIADARALLDEMEGAEK